MNIHKEIFENIEWAKDGPYLACWAVGTIGKVQV